MGTSPFKLLNEGFDHVEFVANKIDGLSKVFQGLGFQKLGERTRSDRGTRSVLLGQHEIRILITEPTQAAAKYFDPALQFLKTQNEGVCVLALEVDDCRRAFAETVERGATAALVPETYPSKYGSVTRAEIWTPGNVRYAFIERQGSERRDVPVLFDEGLEVNALRSESTSGLTRIDHLTNNVDMGEMKKWVKWYRDVFGFIVTRHFDISTGRTGLISDVVQSADGKIIVPINEATEPESQVQEFVDRMKGPGVQHLALETSDILESLKMYRASMEFLSVPHTYYEDVPKRVRGVEENMKDLEKVQILVDGETKDGYLLQIFSAEVLGPFFFEFIQRKGDKGFGEGNFKALFEAIERDQIERGVLKG